MLRRRKLSSVFDRSQTNAVGDYLFNIEEGTGKRLRKRHARSGRRQYRSILTGAATIKRGTELIKNAGRLR